MCRILSAVIVCVAIPFTHATGNDGMDLKTEFEQKYADWQEYLARTEVMVQSEAGTRFTCPEFRAIVRLGPPALPCVIEKMERDPDASLLWRAVSDIAKVRIRAEYDKKQKKTVFPDFPGLDPTKEDVYVRWWHEGRARTPDKLRELHLLWKSQRAAGNDAEAKATRQRIVDLGISALPAILEEIARGDTGLIPIVSDLTDGKVPKSATKEACATWWAADKEKWTLPLARKDEATDPSPE